MKRRNLAFYKESGKPWTKEETLNIYKYCGDEPTSFSLIYLNRKYIFDDGMRNRFMYTWDIDRTPNFYSCEKVSYESIFGE